MAHSWKLILKDFQLFNFNVNIKLVFSGFYVFLFIIFSIIKFKMKPI